MITYFFIAPKAKFDIFAKQMALFFIRSVGNVHNPFVGGGRVGKQKLIGFNVLPQTFTMKGV